MLIIAYDKERNDAVAVNRIVTKISKRSKILRMYQTMNGIDLHSNFLNSLNYLNDF